MTTQPEPTLALTASAPAAELDESYHLHRRFDRMGRLVGDAGMARLFGAHVAVIGLGGVGSWTAESLARSGVGRLTLVDFDLVCVTNTNRQLAALKHTVGKPKSEVLAERLRLINPKAEVTATKRFYNARSADELLAERPDVVVDAIDNITAKCHLLATCKERGLHVVCSGGASGRLDPTQVRSADLAETFADPLAADVRRILRRRYGFPAEGAFGIPAVFSAEKPAAPLELTYDRGQGFRCVCPGGDNDEHSCEERTVIYGTASFVTGTFGLACASLAVRHLLGN
jgi:tRNA threonylcarbamoyladenosine dehydratase